jgi:hypothetical protein
MEFKDIKMNNRLELEVESENPALRNIRGIVLAVGDHFLILVTDYGESLEVLEDRILSISSVSMPKLVSDCMTEMKNHYAEMYDLELRLKALREQEVKLKQALYDANFLSRFNIFGSKNRLDKSVDPNLLTFEREALSYRTSFESNRNEQIEILVKVSNELDYPDLDEVRDVDKIIRVHAPQAGGLLEKCFPFASKPQELEKKVIHEKDSLYSVETLYRLNVDVSRDTFLDVRESIIKGLIRLRK